MIPVTVFTGFLGAGKTTIILGLLKQLPSDYRVVLIKNEFGDLAVDSVLARQQNITGVQELLNGCLCCTLVGQLESALVEVVERFQPDRILIETSGSAFPAPIAFQLRDMERTGRARVHLDSIVTVIDCEQFRGYEDTSYTARLQAQYTDLMVLNKWELVTERQLEDVLDHVLELNPDTPYVKVNPDGGGIDPDLLFGLDTKLFTLQQQDAAPVLREHMREEVDVFRLQIHASQSRDVISMQKSLVERVLSSLDRGQFYRVKGFVWLSVDADFGRRELHVLNFAFGRYEWSLEPIRDEALHRRFDSVLLDWTVMGMELLLDDQAPQHPPHKDQCACTLDRPIRPTVHSLFEPLFLACE